MRSCMSGTRLLIISMLYDSLVYINDNSNSFKTIHAVFTWPGRHNTHAHVHIHVYIYILHIIVYIYICMYIYIYYIYNKYIYDYVYIYIFIYLFTYIYIYISLYLFTCIHVYLCVYCVIFEYVGSDTDQRSSRCNLEHLDARAHQLFTCKIFSVSAVFLWPWGSLGHWFCKCGSKNAWISMDNGYEATIYRILMGLKQPFEGKIKPSLISYSLEIKYGLLENL